MLITSRLCHGRAAVCIGLHPAADTGITTDTLFRSASNVPVLEYGDCLVHAVLYCLSLVSYIVITLAGDIECSSPAPVRLLPWLIPIAPGISRCFSWMCLIVRMFLGSQIIVAFSVRASAGPPVQAVLADAISASPRICLVNCLLPFADIDLSFHVSCAPYHFQNSDNCSR